MAARLNIPAVHLLKFLAERLNKLVLAAAVYEQIIGGNACLSGIDCLAPCYAACGYGYVGILVHNAWALSAKFKYYRCQVFGCSSHYLAAK